ncbi:zinc-ribbon domain-containing protein [Aureibaculum sp. 2210JD6-5]
MKSTTRFSKNKRGIECLNCNQPISDKDNFCSNCGQVIPFLI